MKKIVVLAFALAACTACSSKVDQAYDECVAKQTKKLLQQAEKGPPQLQESMQKDGPKLAEAACGPIKTICADNFDGAMCQTTIDALK